MSTGPNNAFVRVLGPGVLLVGIYLALPFVHGLPAVVLEQVPHAPYVALAGAVGLGWLFARSRAVLTALVLGLAYLAIDVFVAGAPADSVQARAVFALVGILLPINITVIARLPEKGVVTFHGLVGVALVALQAIFAYWLINSFPALFAEILNFDIVPDPRIAMYTPIPQPALLAYMIALGVLIVRLGRQASVFAAGYLGSLVATALAMQAGADYATGAIYFTVAALITIVALAQNSYFLAYFDELTDLPGRRALNEELMRMRGQYTIAMLDVDHFKGFNDNFGHDIGDQVLRMVASKIRRVSGGGKSFRYGGEEFAILFPGKTVKEAFPHLSNLRETIDATHMILRAKDRPDKRPNEVRPRPNPAQQVHVTVSIGVATRRDDVQTADDVIKEADQALYRAKEKGRNRISQ